MANLVDYMQDLIPFSLLLHMYFLPRHPLHFPNIFPPDIFVYRVVYAIYAPSFAYSVFHWGSLIKTTVFGFSALTIFLLPLLKQELRCHRGKSGSKMSKRQYRCTPEFTKDVGNVAITYRALQLIMRQLAFACGPVIPILQAIFGQCIISAGYIFIVEWECLKMYTLVSIISTVKLLTICWGLFLTYAATLYKNSARCVKSWKYGNGAWSGVEAKYMAKFRKSCKPLVIGYPGILTIRPGTVIRFVKGIVRGVFRTVLALKG